jgi:hypothetical protein
MKNKSLYEDYPELGSTKCTFQIKVKFMRNASWQGEIHWVEENKKQNFRSDLEMIRLMDEALIEVTEDYKPLSWKD